MNLKVCYCQTALAFVILFVLGFKKSKGQEKVTCGVPDASHPSNLNFRIVGGLGIEFDVLIFLNG